MQEISKLGSPMIAVALATMGCSSDARDEPRVAAVVDPSAVAFGKTYAEWAAEWYRVSYFEMKGVTKDACVVPWRDETGERCAVGQDPTSPVFFLHGTDLVRMVRERCPVPSGKALFFPIAATWVGSWGRDGLGPGDQRLLMKQWVEHIPIDSLRLEIDGVPVTDFTRFRDDGTTATATLPIPNNLSCEAGLDVSGPGTFTEGGYWVMIPPPAAGKHIIHFAATAFGSPYSLDVTYRFEIR